MTNDRRQSSDHVSRHPELVSGSISPRSQAVIGARWMLKLVQHDGGVGEQSVAYRGQAQIDCQIGPVRVFGFDQVDLPTAAPVFELLFAADRAGHVVEHFETDKAVNAVSRCKSWRQLITMLVKALDQVRRYADIERAIRLAGEYVDARLLGFLHGPRIGSRWTLKQVQGDAIGGFGRY